MKLEDLEKEFNLRLIYRINSFVLRTMSKF